MCFLFFIFSAVVAGALAADTNTTVKPLTVYYESLCPDSIAFITGKLVPTYKQADFNFKPYLKNLTLVPYGHANITDDNFTCQHEKSECDGNILHNCAIKYITDQGMLLTFIDCLMKASQNISKTEPYPPPNTCANSANISADILTSITTCFNSSDDGKQLFKSAGQKTFDFFKDQKFTFPVPYISFSNEINNNKSKKATSNFRQVLCSEVGLNNNACSDTKSGAASLSATFTLISAILVFSFARQ